MNLLRGRIAHPQTNELGLRILSKPFVAMMMIMFIVLMTCSVGVESTSPSDNLSQWMIDSFTTLKLKASNGSSVDTAAVSCGAIRDYYLSKGSSLSAVSGNLFNLFLLDGNNNKITYQTVCIFDESSKGAWALALDLKDGSDATFSYTSQYWTNNATVGSVGSPYTNLKTLAFSKHVAHSLRMTTVKGAFILDHDGFIVESNKTNTAIFTVSKKSLLEAFSDESSPSRVIPGSLRSARNFYSLAPDYTSAKYCANKLVGFNMGNSNYLRVRFGVVTSSNASCSESGKLDAYIGIGGSQSGAYHGMGGQGTTVCSHPRKKLAYKYACESASFTTASLYVGDQFDCSSLNYCSGHGICAGNNLCQCEDGITSANCSIICNPGCVHGSCVATNKCQCEPGWTGPLCDKPSCYGKAGNDSTVCNSRGDCIALDTCSCRSDFYGNECEYSKCGGKFANDSTVCHSHGICNSLTGICNCTTGFYGNDCEVWKCYGVLSNETLTCSGHGVCVSTDNCTCNTGFINNDCSGSLFTCFGVSASSQSVCSGMGSCVAQDSCSCVNSTVYGVQCEMLKCNGKMMNDSTVCSSSGQCISGVCNCNSTTYGNDCQFIKCNGKTSSDPTVCSSNGTCSSSGICSCNSTNYGNDCQYIKCNGKIAEDATVCSSAGQCISGTCNCNATTYGNDCQFLKCNGKTVEDPSVCSSNGTCVSGVCSCNSTNYGNDCQYIKCNGKIAEDATVCSSAGQCISGVCHCNSSTYGNDCQYIKCNGKTAQDPLVCSSNGTCSSSGICYCNSTNYGSDCEFIKCNGKTGNDPTVCSSAGQCIAGSCVCNATTYGNDCQFLKCNGKTVEDPLVCSSNGTCLSGVCSCNSTNYGNDCQYIKCNGKIAEDATVCSSAGQCISGVCHCNSSTYGNDCQFLKCNGKTVEDPSVCSSNGTCLSGVCSCNSTNYGNDCQYIKCNGKIAEDATVCSSAGQCISGVCHCNSSTYGNDCQYMKCNGKTVEDPSVCSSNGICIYGVCSCNNNFTGNDCQYHTCNRTIFNSPSVCSSRGSCVSVNNCSCLTGFYGDNCEFIIPGTVTCYGVASLSPQACSGNGYCVGENNCSCKTGYAGDACEHKVCYGILSNSSSVCSGNGSCVAPDSCNCNTGYTGLTCQIPICYGIMANETTVCSNSNGTCTAPNTCSCKTGYTGSKCETPICYGKAATSPNVCSGKGVCSKPNSCTCPAATSLVTISGNECQYLQCLGKENTFHSSTDSRVCGGRGTCTQSGCQCNTGYSGNYCQIYACDNIRFDQSGVCNGHGNCTGYNTCSCNENNQDGYWQGTYCDVCRVDYETELTGCKKLKCDPATTCNQHGYCNANLQCVCNGNWDGKFCSYCKTNYFGSDCGAFCEKSTTCSGHGECTSNGTCSCYSNSQEGYWEGSSCNKCQASYYGSKCATQIIGPAKFLDMFNGIVFKVVGPTTYTQSKVDCARLISSSQLALFGVGPVCLWTNRASNEFTILFGDDYTLMPGAVVGMNRFALDPAGTDLQDVTVLNADNPVTPVVVFSGLNNIGTCDNFTLDASASYSGDRKPLKYYWTIVSSPNNFLSIPMPNSSVLQIDYVAMQSPGEYKFSLQVESSISGKISSVSIWTVTKASIPLPVVSIIGFNDKTIIKYESPLVVKKHVELPVCFYQNQELNVVWEQISGPATTSEMDKFNNLAITHFSGLVVSTYEFKITVTSVVNSLSTATDTIKINVSPSPLSLILYPDEVSSEVGTVVVNLVDPDTTGETETWSWSCFDATNNLGCGSVIDTALVTYANDRTVRPLLSSADLKVYATMPTLKLTLSVVKGIRSVQTTLDFVFPESKKVPPTVSLISVTPTKAVILKQDIVNLQLAVTANGESVGIDQYISRSWTLNSKVLSNSDAVLSKMTINPTLSNSIVIDPATLEDGATYILTLKVTDNRNGLSAEYSYSFQIARPPQACPCTISPSKGIALETSFSFACTNCQNAQNTLQVVYGFIDDKSGANIPLYQNGEVYSTKLPCSYTPLTNKIVTTYIRITDKSTGAYTELKNDITIDLASVKTVTEVKKKVASYSNIQNSLKDGDTAKMVFNSATISRVADGMLTKISTGARRRSTQLVCQNGGTLNTETNKCNCASGFAKEDCSITGEDFNAYKEIRVGLMDEFIQTFEARNPYEIITETYLTLQTYGLDSLIEKYDELDENSMNKAYDIVNTLLKLSEYNKDLRVPFGVDRLFTNILNSIYKYISYNGFSETDHLSSLFTMMKRVSNLMLRGIFVGERDLQLQTVFASIAANKLFRAGFESRITSPIEGAVVLLPVDMPIYLSEKSNRKIISYISISSSDLFGISKNINKAVIISENQSTANSSKVSTVVSSTMYLRSDVLFFELMEASADVLTPINYNMTTFSIKNYQSDSLISNIKTSESTKEVVTRTYRTSEFVCKTFKNFTLGVDPSCVLELSSNNTATCKCNSTTSTLLLENILEKVITITTPIKVDDDQNLGIILGVVLGFSCLLCILLVFLGILLKLRCTCCKRKKPVFVVEEEDPEVQIEMSNFTV